MKKLLFTLIIPLMLAACGGGGDAALDAEAGNARLASTLAATPGGTCARVTVQLYGESAAGRAGELQAHLDATFGHVAVKDTTKRGMRIVQAIGYGLWPDQAAGAEIVVMQFGDADAKADAANTRPDYTPEILRQAFNTHLMGVYGSLPYGQALVLVKPRNAAYAAEVDAVHAFYLDPANIPQPPILRDVSVVKASGIFKAVDGYVRSTGCR